MPRYIIECATTADREAWDGYVRKHSQAGLYHMFGWRDVIHRTYGHATYYLIAFRSEDNAASRGSEGPGYNTATIQGVLPLVHLKQVICGYPLISMPFLDGGGILASCRAAEEGLLSEAIGLARELGASGIELRHEQPLSCWDQINALCIQGPGARLDAATKSHKVRMLLALPESSEMLMKSFKSKLRSQIKNPLKEGLTSKTGGVELLEDFYKVFATNMRDLGSPVHSAKLMHYVLSEFPGQSKVIVVYRDKTPLASSLVMGFNEILCNPWASSLRKYALLGPNMLLYLRMLEYACDHGYRIFDFGRSSPGEGTYRFKKQWGAIPTALHWHYITLDGKPLEPESSKKGRFGKASRYWKMLPLPVTRIIGPSIRKYIGL